MLLFRLLFRLFFKVEEDEDDFYVDEDDID